MKLRVWAVNVYRKNPSLLQLRSRLEQGRADAIGCQEAVELAGVEGYRRFRCDIAAGAAGIEVANLLRRDADYRGHGAYQASDHTGDPVGHDRWIVWTRWVQGGHQLVLINSHFNAEVQDGPTGRLVKDRRVDEYRTHMRRLVREIRRQHVDGWLPIVTLDANYFRRRQQRGRLWRWSPHRALRRAGLTYLSHGLMGVAVPRSVAVLHAGTVKLPGADHPALEIVIELEEVRHP